MKRYGPFTPQEIGKVTAWFAERNVEFRLIKDEKTESEFRENTPYNLVSQVEFRTKTFLAQIFSVEAEMGEADELHFRKFFNLVEDVPPRFRAAHDPALADISPLTDNIEKKKQFVRTIARVALLLLVLMNLKALEGVYKFVTNLIKSLL